MGSDEELRLNPRIFQHRTGLHGYKVCAGDTIANIAERIGCPWQDLAILNWGTDVPEEINWYLGNYFVCTRKAGVNYVFSDDDEPGILLLPAYLDPAGLKVRRIARATRWRGDSGLG